jgi:transposase
MSRDALDIDNRFCPTTVGSSIRETFPGDLPAHRVLGMLHIGRPWVLTETVVTTYPVPKDFRDADIRGEIEFRLDVERGILYRCPVCGRMCKAHAYETRCHRDVKLLGYAVTIRSKVPKLRCDGCGGFPQMEIPWARPRVSYTIEMEREVLRNLSDRSISATAKSLGIGHWIVADIVSHRVEEAKRKLDLSNVTKIYVDETSFRKGHDYVTVVCDQEKRIIFMCEGKDSSTMDRFAEWLVERGGDPANIAAVSCDMGLAYPAGCRRNFPKATIIFDKFHVIKLIGDAFDKVRKRLLKDSDYADKLRFLCFKHENSLTDRQRELKRYMDHAFLELSEEYRMKEVASQLYSLTTKEAAIHHLMMLKKEVENKGSPEMRGAIESLWNKRKGILSWFDWKMNNGFAEAVNSLIQTTKRVARGFRNRTNFINMCFYKNGHLEMMF